MVERKRSILGIPNVSDTVGLLASRLESAKGTKPERILVVSQNVFSTLYLMRPRKKPIVGKTEEFGIMSSLPAATFASNSSPSKGEFNTIPFASFPIDPLGRPDLTIHRKTDTHHGATLQILGHAAEYLAESRRYMMCASKSDAEAIHILMRLSREIFEEYAETAAVRTRFHDWVMDKMARCCA